MIRPVNGLGKLGAEVLNAGGVGMRSCKVERRSSVCVQADAGGGIKATLQDFGGA